MLAKPSPRTSREVDLQIIHPFPLALHNREAARTAFSPSGPGEARSADLGVGHERARISRRMLVDISDNTANLSIARNMKQVTGQTHSGFE